MDEEIQAANLGETETPVAESAPVEETTTESEVEAPVETDISQPTEAEKTVPLSALQRERELRKQAEEEAALLKEITKKGRDITTTASNDDELFDSDTSQTLDKWYARKRAEEFAREQEAKSAVFAEKHAEELKDPLLDAMTRKVISDANALGKTIDQEDALQIAKSTLEVRLKTAEEKAKESGFDQGQQTAHKKILAGAVGETSVKAAPIDPSTLSAEEFAAYYNIPRAD